VPGNVRATVGRTRAVCGRGRAPEQLLGPADQ
jgi:hypothetical protein